MATTIKEIGNGGEFHLRFKKTKIFKRYYTGDEILIDEFDYEGNGEGFSEIIWKPSEGRGFGTWFNFNKLDRLEKNGVIDYHKTFFMTAWKYASVPEHNLEYVQCEHPDSPFSVTITCKNSMYYAHIIISYENYYFRVEFSLPFINSFKN